LSSSLRICYRIEFSLMAYSTLDILQSLAHANSHAHLFMSVGIFKAELWIKAGHLKRIVASDKESLLVHFTKPDPNLVLQPLNSETFLEHTKGKIDLNDLALHAAHHVDSIKLQEASGNKKESGKKSKLTITQALYADVFFSIAIPLIIQAEQNNVTILGRDQQLSTLKVEDARVSRKHCRISLGENRHFEVHDLGSTNGTYLNGNRVTRSQAKLGDFVRVGDHVFCLS